MSTIREISALTGVSIATVSKALNGLPGVSAKTVALVLEKARELNYRPNLTARNLKTGSSRTIGIIAEDITVFSTPMIIDGIGVCCEKSDYHYILGNLRFTKRYGTVLHDEQDQEREERVLDMVNTMLSKQVDGIIYISCHTRNVVSLSNCKETKFVSVYSCARNDCIPSVTYDEFDAAHQVAELLIGKGHVNIGLIAGPNGSQNTANRLRGFQQSLFEHNIPYDPRLTFFCDWDYDKAYACVSMLLEKGATAIFAHNDAMAMGVVDYCNKHDVQIGKDFMIVGFDNREIAMVCRPSLTSVSVPLFDMGYKAAEVMVNLLERGVMPAERFHLLPCSIVERDSTLGI